MNEFLNGEFIQKLESHLGPALAPALVALALTAMLTPLAIQVARATGFISHPRKRDVHARPIPYLGGPALFLGFAGADLIFLPNNPMVPPLLVLGGITTVLFLIDDRVSIPAWLKLGLQIAIATAAVTAGHFQIDFVHIPGIGTPHLYLLALPMTVIWIVGMQNTVNLIDGLDGLAGGVVAITALVLLLAATSFLPEQAPVEQLAAALVGACAGFLIFNFNPARIFMGDSGSHFLGLTLALLAVIGVAKVTVVAAVAIPVLAMGIPITDTLVAIVRRHRRGVSVAQADNHHLHHRLLFSGFSQREICALIYCCSAILGAISLAVIGHRKILGGTILVLAGVVSLLVVNRLRADRRPVTIPEIISLFEAPPPASEEEPGEAAL